MNCRRLRASDQREARAAFQHNHHILDIVNRFPAPGIDAATLRRRPAAVAAAALLDRVEPRRRARTRRISPSARSATICTTSRALALHPDISRRGRGGCARSGLHSVQRSFPSAGRRRADPDDRRRHRRRALSRLHAGAGSARRGRQLLAVVRRAQFPQRFPLSGRMAGACSRTAS